MNGFTLRTKFLVLGAVLASVFIGGMGLVVIDISSASLAMNRFATVEIPILNKAHELNWKSYLPPSSIAPTMPSRPTS